MGSVPVKLLGKIALNELNCLELWPSSIEARVILVIFALFLPKYFVIFDLDLDTIPFERVYRI